MTQVDISNLRFYAKMAAEKLVEKFGLPRCETNYYLGSTECTEEEYRAAVNSPQYPQVDHQGVKADNAGVKPITVTQAQLITFRLKQIICYCRDFPSSNGDPRNVQKIAEDTLLALGVPLPPPYPYIPLEKELEKPQHAHCVKCKTHAAGTTGGSYPQDCDWPFCGCDPKADKVLEAIQESGYMLIKAPGAPPAGLERIAQEIADKIVSDYELDLEPNGGKKRATTWISNAVKEILSRSLEGRGELDTLRRDSGTLVSILWRLAQSVGFQANENGSWKWEDAEKFIAGELDALRREDAGLRRRIHVLEQHNQHFERCESAWCHPADKQFENPALESFKQSIVRADAAEARTAQLEAALRRVNDALKEMAEWHGGTHEDDCPLDDTCDCKHKPFNQRVNNAIDEAEAALAAPVAQESAE